MKDNNIVTLEIVKEDELEKFKEDLKESFSVTVIEEFGSIDAGPIPSDKEIEESSIPSKGIIQYLHIRNYIYIQMKM